MEPKLTKQERTQAAIDAKESRARKHLLSLHHCLARSDVMRIHHDMLIGEIEASGIEAFTAAKKVRFSAYLAFWFTGLAGVVERFEELTNSDSIPGDEDISKLITPEFKSVVKSFRNSVAHCSDHDDQRTLQLLDHERWVPDQAAALADAFHSYFAKNKARQP